MSAFICSDRHVSILAAYGTMAREGFDLYANRRHYTNPQEVFNILKAENIRSVLHRYPGDTIDSAPGTIGEAREFDRAAIFLARHQDPVQILKACACLEYQSCETPDYRETEAFHLLEAIRYVAINNLPGYKDAQWEMSA